MQPFQFKRLLLVLIVLISAETSWLFYDAFTDQFVCIERMSPPVKAAPRLRTSVWRFTLQPAYFYVGQSAGITGGRASARRSTSSWGVL